MCREWSKQQKKRRSLVWLLTVITVMLGWMGRDGRTVLAAETGSSLESGKVDVVIPNMTATPALEYTSFDQFEGKKVGVVTGTIFDAMIEKFLPGAVADYYNTYPDVTLALTSGKVEAFMVDEPIARSITADRTDIAYIPEFIQEDRYAFVLPKENTALAEEINQILADMKQEGFLDEMDEKWFGTDESKKVIPDLNVKPEGSTRGTLRLVVDSATPPFTYVVDGEVVGYDVEIAKNICNRLGYDLEVDSADFAAIIPGVLSGKYDMGVGCISITEERAKSVTFTEPDYEGGVVVVVRIAEEKGPTGFLGNLWSTLRESFDKTFLREARWKLIVKGLLVTCLISVASAIVGSALGFGLCMMRRARRKLAVIPAKVIVKVIQGTPIVVILMILYYVVFSGKFSLNPIAVAIIGFAINFGAYVSEMMRTGIEAVDKGQIEAASAMGYGKMAVFWKVTFPQAARHFLPVYRGEFISMVKMTSVVGYIAIQDLTKAGDIIRSRTYEAFFPLIATAVIYFMLSSVLASVLTFMEKKTDPKRRKRTVEELIK